MFLLCSFVLILKYDQTQNVCFFSFALIFSLCVCICATLQTVDKMPVSLSRCGDKA